MRKILTLTCSNSDVRAMLQSLSEQYPLSDNYVVKCVQTGITQCTVTVHVCDCGLFPKGKEFYTHHRFNIPVEPTSIPIQLRYRINKDLSTEVLIGNTKSQNLQEWRMTEGRKYYAQT